MFGDDLSLPKVEERIGRALSPYGLSKYINELYAGVFARCYGLRWIGLRYFNVFGPRQDADGPYASVIPAWIGALLRGETAYINGDGTAARDFCHVDNVVQMNLRAAMTDDESALDQAYNVAHGEMTSLAELFDIIRALLGRRQPQLQGVCPVHREPRRGDILLSRADIRKAQRLLGYEPTVRIMDGLESTMDWYIAQLAPREEGRSPMYRTIIEGETVLEEEPVLPTVAVIGLGYVGLPVAIAFGKERRTIGYDHSKKRVENLKHRVDTTGEVSAAELIGGEALAADHRRGRARRGRLHHRRGADADQRGAPARSAAARVGERDRRPAHEAGRDRGYESTVYPGAPRKCACRSSRSSSGMRWRQDFHVGYSPERINPGDKEHTLTRIPKVVSGDDAETLEKVAALYGVGGEGRRVPAPSIKVAEAAKVIENTQRDLNIAFMNELAIIFERLGIDTHEVLQAAGTKWNFLPFRPGLVGGHCIGVDPYYLTYKAELAGYHPR